MTDRELIDLATAAMQNAYAPYSRFRVGAAAECVGGEVYTGCNVENAAFGSTICAEQAAVCAAVAGGNRQIRRIAIVSEGGQYPFPCGNCRQVLGEFSMDIEVLAARADGRYVSYALSALLPCAFTGEQF